MRFDILELILWPHDPLIPPKQLRFEPGKVNIITGISGSGKSAVISILDYCLGSSEARIPVGPIRNKCAWYGVRVKTNRGELLLARQDQGDNKGGSENMLILEGEEIKISNVTPHKNASRNNVVHHLDNLVKLGDGPIDPEEASENRSSFRDLVGFCFQPQYLIANPRVLFYRTDTAIHTERLKRVFPFALGAENARVLDARWRLVEAEKELRGKERLLTQKNNEAEGFQRELDRWLSDARVRGLLDPSETILKDAPSKIDRLRRVISDALSGVDLSSSRVEKLSRRKIDLEQEERSKDAELTDFKRRIQNMDGLREASQGYRRAIEVQHSRLQLSSQLRKRYKAISDKDISICPLCKSENAFGATHNLLEELCASLESMEQESRKLPSEPPALYLKHYHEIKKRTDELAKELAVIRDELKLLDRKSDKESESSFTTAALNQFIGALRQAITGYETAQEDNNLNGEIERIRNLVNSLVSDIRRSEQGMTNALERISFLTGELVSNLQIENPAAPIKLKIKDLMISILIDDREDPLWAIGSGANWVGYHVALLLGLHRFFRDNNSPVPGFIVFDQPSQLNYPRELTQRYNAEELIEKRSEFSLDVSIEALKKIYSAFGRVVQEEEQPYRPQVLVLDHAMGGVWGHVKDINHVADWSDEGNKLVPDNWPSR
ncbi:MAG: DUF3732 domain-containing protein [Magnetococcales bacterium]|nr:DUF3732 domain-containing protein [Magnetococcales bacterium]